MVPVESNRAEKYPYPCTPSTISSVSSSVNQVEQSHLEERHVARTASSLQLPGYNAFLRIPYGLVQSRQEKRERFLPLLRGFLVLSRPVAFSYIGCGLPREDFVLKIHDY